ncbi:MAG: general secretion pathway protein GspK [Desulfobacteraceae bacterium]|nr:general secretion pathway protein GspK [Desulfobacteraceae bacterium]MBC2755764.1 general secretion pathway protein GspK [Desulfobacteraceae bacterium]
MEKHPYYNNKGIALIITLTVIALLVTVTFELNRQLQASVISSAIVRDRLILSHMISSGVEIAEAILIKDKNDSEIDSVQEDWANPDKIEAYLSQVPFDEGKIGLFISDELGRIQVNALVQFPEGKDFNPPQKDLWFRFMALILAQQENLEDEDMLFEEVAEPSAIINPIKDWLDSNDNDAITGLNGAENEYYKDLDPPYPTRNGPFRHIEELIRTKGITPDLFYTADVQMLGISNFITVHGVSDLNDKFIYTGKININTADLPVIAGLLPVGQEFLSTEIFNYRIESANEQFIYELTSPTWYKDVPGCSEVDIDAELITTQSDIFRIECNAALRDIMKTATVIVQREKNKESGKWYCKVLNWTYE